VTPRWWWWAERSVSATLWSVSGFIGCLSTPE